MPKSYPIDLCWRIVWAYLVQSISLSEIIAELFSVFECTMRRYIHLFYQTGDVQPSDGGKRGPQKLLGDNEQLILLNDTD